MFGIGSSLPKSPSGSGLKRIKIADERDDAASRQMIEMLETIDDDLGEMEFDLVKISDPEFADREYGIKRGSPAIVYFENGVPSVFDGEQDYS